MLQEPRNTPTYQVASGCAAVSNASRPYPGASLPFFDPKSCLLSKQLEKVVELKKGWRTKVGLMYEQSKRTMETKTKEGTSTTKNISKETIITKKVRSGVAQASCHLPISRKYRTLATHYTV